MRTYTFQTPIVGYAEEGQTDSLSFDDMVLISGQIQDMFAGVPWKLLSARLECSLVMGNDATTTQDPALIQFALNSGTANNVENVASSRFLVSTLPVKRYLRMPSPNIWKEDEDRTQALIYIENISLSKRTNSPVMYYLVPTFLFGRIPIDKPKPKLYRNPRSRTPSVVSDAASALSLEMM